MTLAQWIANTGETQRAIAQQWGMPEATLSDLVTGRRNPSLKMALRIKELTGGKVKLEHWGDGAAA